MKKVLLGLLVTFVLLSMYACQKTFLQVPDTTGNVTLEKVYSNATNATSALLNCYANVMANEWGPGNNFFNGTVGCIAGERSMGYSWHASYYVTLTGLSPVVNTTAGMVLEFVNYNVCYNNIRAICLVNENIDQVPDMDPATKGYVHAETKGLLAKVYALMFKDFGGVPIVTHSFTPSDNTDLPRASLQQTLNYALQLCDSAILGLPDAWPAAQTGRLTKGAIMMLKEQILLYAARPLFNSATPYLDFGQNNKLISFGSAEPKRWDSVITATNNALNWCNNNGFGIINTGGGVNIPNANAFNDYGKATSQIGPTNTEVVFAHHYDNNSNATSNLIAYYYNESNYFTASRYNNQLLGLQYNSLLNYYKKDGTDQSWPKVGDAAPRPGSDYVTRFQQMEPRFLADFAGPGCSAANNAGDNNWSVNGWGGSLSNNGSVFPNGNYGFGCATTTKFYWHAGNRLMMEPPLFRVAELYLTLAEAYNEKGQTAQALQNLNIVHNRAGLPSITETDQAKLRTAIQREWAIEYYNEGGKRYWDVKHWKLQNIGTEIIGGPKPEFQFAVTSTVASTVNLASNLNTYWSSVAFTQYWSPKMFLEPIPQTEVNKLVVLQNPGY